MDINNSEYNDEIKNYTISEKQIKSLMNYLNIIPVTTYEQTMTKMLIYQIIEQITIKHD